MYPPPQFIIPLQNVQQTEGARVHMEARIEPVGDPSMVVEWYLNGRPLAASKLQQEIPLSTLYKFPFPLQVPAPHLSSSLASLRSIC